MAQQRVRIITRDHTPQFGFGSIKIYPDECLGTGAYGAVCKAMCDELPCAAKLLHSVLFQFNDPGMPAMMRRFQQECELMGRIRHPCIVQYLGTVQDPESRRPILLMELMDESLTKFLERSTAPLAYQLQVNLSYDIALALAYLHSNGVVHRDLSSNNVLITAGSRAKVTDFGMLKLLEQNMRMTPLTKCPGTVAYMPPEALSDEPEYTDKLDCFSLGVLMIQMITRNFPEPTKATVTVRDSKYPTGRILVPVPEVERRMKDVDLVDDRHPIKLIFLSCLKDIEKERPSARDICHRLVELKAKEQYSESFRQYTIHGKEECQRLREENLKLEQEQHSLQEERSKLKEGLQAAISEKEAKQVELEKLKKAVSTKDREIEELKKPLTIMTLTKSDFSKQNAASIANDIILEWNDKIKVKSTFGMLRGAACADETVAYFNTGGVNVYSYNCRLSKQWIELPELSIISGFALVIICDLLTTVGGYKSNKLFTFNGKEWVEKYPRMSTKRYYPAAVCSGHYLVVAGGQDKQCQSLPTVEVMDTSTLQWFTAASLPRGIHKASLTTCGDDLYLLGDDSTHVYSCSLQSLLQSCQAPGKASAIRMWNRITGRVSTSQETSIWNRITDLPVSRSTAVTLCGQLVSVGGIKDNKLVDSVYCYHPVSSEWKITGTIPLSQSWPLVTTLPGNKMIVVYGMMDIYNFIAVGSCCPPITSLIV